MLAREDNEVHLHASATKTEQLQLCVWANCHLEKLHHCYKKKHLDHRMHLFTQNVHVVTGSNLTVQRTR